MVIKLNSLDAMSRQTSQIAGSYKTTGSRGLILYTPSYTVLSIFLSLLPGPARWDRGASALHQSDHVYIPKHTMNHQFRLSEGS